METESNLSSRSKYGFALVTTLCVVFGMQFLRIILPAFRYYLRDTLGIGSLTLAPIALAVFALGLLAIPVLRIFGSRVALGIAVVGMALLRLLAQFSTQASFDLAISLGGVTLFAFFLIYAAAQARHNQNWGQLAFFVLFGVSLDTAIHTAAATLDLVWQFDTVPILVVLILTLSLVVAYRFALSDGSVSDLNEVGWGTAWPLLAIGPWIFLQMLLFQNVARVATFSGLSLPLAGLLLALGNLAGLALALWAMRSGPRSPWIVALLGLLLVVTTLPHDTTGWVGTGAILAGLLISFLLLTVILLKLGEGELSQTLTRTTIWIVVGMEILVLCSFLYYASFDIALGFKAPIIPLIASILVALAGWSASRRGAEATTQQPEMSYSLVWLGLLLLAFPVFLLLRWDTPEAQPAPAAGTPLQVMTYNIHQGYSRAGRMELEAQAQEIENSNADIVALQEVSRGNLVNGSTDTIEWLSQRLGMPYVFGPTMDPVWGNAILSRYPIRDYTLHMLSPDLLVRRGYIDANIEAGGEPLRVMATHYHHLEEDSDIRVIQTQEIIDGWGGTPRTIFLGDLNATPGDPEMVMLTEAGFLDTLFDLSYFPPDNYTFISDEPYQQIDYIWVTPDLSFQDAIVLQLTASDHLPVLAEVGGGN